MTALDPRDVLAAIAETMAADTLALHDVISAAYDASDLTAVAHIRQTIRQTAAHLRVVDEIADRRLARLMPTRQVTIPGLGIINRYSDGPLGDWQDEDLLSVIADREIAEAFAGGIPDPVRRKVIKVALGVLDVARIKWHPSKLRAIGVAPEKYATRLERRQRCELPALEPASDVGDLVDWLRSLRRRPLHGQRHMTAAPDQPDGPLAGVPGPGTDGTSAGVDGATQGTVHPAGTPIQAAS